MHSHVICFHLYPLIFYPNALVCHLYVSRMYSYVICMLLVCTRMSSVCHSHVLVCHRCATRMYSYVIRMSLISTRMSTVCRSYLLVCHLYVTRMWYYHEPYLGSLLGESNFTLYFFCLPKQFSIIYYISS